MELQHNFKNMVANSCLTNFIEPKFQITAPFVSATIEQSLSTNNNKILIILN